MTTYRSVKPRWRKGFLDKLESLFLDKLLLEKRKIALIRIASYYTDNTVLSLKKKSRTQTSSKKPLIL